MLPRKSRLSVRSTKQQQRTSCQHMSSSQHEVAALCMVFFLAIHSFIVCAKKNVSRRVCVVWKIEKHTNERVAQIEERKEKKNVIKKNMPTPEPRKKTRNSWREFRFFQLLFRLVLSSPLQWAISNCKTHILQSHKVHESLKVVFFISCPICFYTYFMRTEVKLQFHNIKLQH